MKQENFNKKNAQSVARVKSLIKAKLAWMSGFPVRQNNQLIWFYSYSGFYHDQQIAVDHKLLSKAQRTVNTLFRDYPVALPAVVGDSQLWHKRVLAYIKYAKYVIDIKTNIVPSLFDLDPTYAIEQRRVIKRLPINSAAITLMSWKHYLDRTNIKRSFKFFTLEQIKSDVIDSISLMNMSALYALDSTKSIGLIKFVTFNNEIDTITDVDRSWFSPYLELKSLKAIKKRIRSFEPTKFPDDTNSQALDYFFKQISGFKAAYRRRCLALFDCLELVTNFSDWQHWWQKISIPVNKINNHMSYGMAENTDEIELLRHQVKTLFDHKPNSFLLSDVLEAIITGAEKKVCCSALCSALNLLRYKTQEYPPSHAFLIFWSKLLNLVCPKPEIFKVHIISVSEYLNKHNENLTSKSPWKIIPSYIWGSIDADVLQNASIKQINVFFDAIGQIISSKNIKLEQNELYSLLQLTLGGFSPEKIVDLYPQLSKSKSLDDISELASRIACQFDLSVAEFLSLLEVQEKLYFDGTYYHGLEYIYDIFKARNQVNVLVNILKYHDVKQLIKNIYQIRVIDKISGKESIPMPVYPVHCDAEWIAHYPQEFEDLLQQINGLDHQVENKVKSIFKSIWWPEKLIESEIAKLKFKSEKIQQQVPILKRIQKLEYQLKNHQSLTEHKRNKIANKLKAFANRLYLANWQANLDQQFTQDWASLFQINQSEMPEWLTNSQVIIKLLPLMDFDIHSKNLAIKVIKNRCQEPFYYLKKENKNKSFKAAMLKKGVDLSLWPDGMGCYQYQAKNNELVTLSIESDPLEMIDMGGHFRTCLSPGNFNYFSVFTNIADINKQIIYARNDQNKVVGRVLIGMTDYGSLQVFNRYSHHKDYQFEHHAMKFINEIANKMGSILSHHGQVTSLCCSKWYDDGANYVDPNYSCLKKDSAFLNSLFTMRAKAFIPELKKVLLPQKLNPLIFFTLLNLTEVTENKTLFPELITLSCTISNLSDTDIMLLYEKAIAIGFGESCYQCHRKRIMNYLNNQLFKFHYPIDHYGIDIARHHPSDALKLIKIFAKVNKFNWKQGLSFGYKKMAYIALTNLSRHHLAQRFES